MNVAEVTQLAGELAASRHVATLVARGAPSAELFDAATAEVGRALAVDGAHLDRYEVDGTVTVLAAWSEAGDHRPPVGGRWIVGGRNLSALVLQTGTPARIDDYGAASGPTAVAAREAGHRSGVATPIIVDGRLWGAMCVVAIGEEPLPGDTESRLTALTELLAMAIASAESRADLARLADEQAALRRVATLVARGVPPQELFAAVTKEVAQLLGVARAAMCRYEPDCAVAFVAGWDCCGGEFPAVGRKWPIEEKEIAMLVARTVRPARVEGFRGEWPRDSTHDGTGDEDGGGGGGGGDSLVGTPIVVDGRLWGVITVAVPAGDPLPRDTETRLAAFTDLLATAIANADSRAELGASRARIVAAADRERRRIERDLHDGAQQRLVGLGLQLRAAQAAMPSGLGELHGELEQIAQGLARVQDGLREMARGIHPAILAHGGLGPVLKAIARRSPLRVKFDIRGLARLPEQVEVAAYYVVSEALANAAKHAFASVVHVEVEQVDGVLRVGVRDDGAGGADPSRGTGLVGLKDRVETLGGRINVSSAPEAGTSLEVEIPVSG
ncbi:MAG: sensor histidine kinase [Solirubrobacteraceae bacterium]